MNPLAAPTAITMQPIGVSDDIYKGHKKARSFDMERSNMADFMSAPPAERDGPVVAKSEFIKTARRPSLVADAASSRVSQVIEEPSTKGKEAMQDWVRQQLQVKSTTSLDAKPLTFTAVFHSTDDDYLMKRSVREYFKENTLNPEDLVRFLLHLDLD
jgi:hypothetical protein